MTNKLLSPLAIAFQFQIKKERLRELRDAASFPEPDKLRYIADTLIGIPYWRYETVAKFLETHPEEDHRKPYLFVTEDAEQ